MPPRDHVRFYLNGRTHAVRGSEAFRTVAEYLRDCHGLTGTKLVCAEGDCGACTVLVGRPIGGAMRYESVDSCIRFVCQLDAAHLVTVEGLSAGGELHPVQRAMVACHGSQCGYCTPGFVMSLAGWAEAGADPADVRLALTGNLCRCTGYVQILEAASEAARLPLPRLAEQPGAAEIAAELRSWSEESLRVEADGRTYFAPNTLTEAVAFREAVPDATVIAGATELGVLRNKRGLEPRSLLALSRIPELDGIRATGGRVSVGANVTWAEIERGLVPILPQIAPVVRRFGGPQIRHVATLAGNVMNGSPIADALPVLLVLDAELAIAGSGGTRCRPLNSFYTGYKRTDLVAGELLARVEFPLPTEGERLRLYKVSRRHDLDIATVGAAIRVHESGGVIRRAAVAFSGVGPTVSRLSNAEAALVGRPFTEATFRAAGRIARDEIAPLTDVRGSEFYRRQLVENLLVKFATEEGVPST